MRYYLTLLCALFSYGLQAQNMVGFQVDMSGYTGYQPRCPPASYGSAEWATVSQSMMAPPPPPAE